jgi:ParB-like chromosome segregation protein Spo0J
MTKEEIIKNISQFATNIAKLEFEERVETINSIKVILQEQSPFKNEPVDCVVWVKSDNIRANDYNPNTVASPEMKLLEQSIEQDGYTQPIVSWYTDGVYEVVDGFHRNRVGRECKQIAARVNGYLPITIINGDRQDLGDRMASTIRHNRARGKHRVEAMSDIVIELKRRNWSDDKIAKNLGMDADEVLRLTQITGLAEMFSNSEFTEAWEVDESFIDTTLDEEEYISEAEEVRLSEN